MKPAHSATRTGLAAALAFLIILAAVPTTARAQARDHEEGFFLRLSAGGGSASTQVDVPANGFMPATTMKFSGTAGDVNIAIGGIVASNLALHGTLFGWSIAQPDLEAGGQSAISSGDLTLAGFGGGVTYYFMPVNFYLSGSIGAGKLEFNEGSVSGRSSAGLMFDATAGKEWWVGDSWGLGVALGLSLHSIPDEGTDDNWSGGSVAIRFTATMN
jgi:hypothetical protein